MPGVCRKTEDQAELWSCTSTEPPEFALGMHHSCSNWSKIPCSWLLSNGKLGKVLLVYKTTSRAGCWLQDQPLILCAHKFSGDKNVLSRLFWEPVWLWAQQLGDQPFKIQLGLWILLHLQSKWMSKEMDAVPCWGLWFTVVTSGNHKCVLNLLRKSSGYCASTAGIFEAGVWDLLFPVFSTKPTKMTS